MAPADLLATLRAAEKQRLTAGAVRRLRLTGQSAK
jgi:hypothetical protein